MKYIKKFNEKIEPEIRAGVIPYYIEDKDIKMMFFIPSDFRYGGDKYQIAKGRVDPGEDVETAAIREAFEELGLNKRNIKKTFLSCKKKLIGYDNYPYDIYIYASEVFDKEDFSEYGYETGETIWLNMKEFRECGRKSQLDIVEETYKKIMNNL
jgi:8-oxo-dGTP pyrophosphatase MutT (NUDIX family)